MSEKRYPTRMHEVLGVETGQVFYFEGANGLYQEYVLDGKGRLFRNHKTQRIESPRMMVDIINRPERIVRKPRLSKYAIDILKALKTLGYEWVSMDNQLCMWAYNSHPYRENWDKKTLIFGTCYDEVLPILKHKEPLDIVATLKAAGVEVEE